MSENQPAVTQYTATWPLVRRMWGAYIQPRIGQLFYAMVLMVITAAMTGAMAAVMEPVIDKVFSVKDSARLLWPVSIAVFLIFTIRGLASYGQTVLMNSLGQRIVCDMQRDMFAHLIHADLAYFHGRQSGELMSRFISDMTMIRAAVTESLTGIGKNTFTLFFLVGVMFYQDWKLTLATFFVFPAAAYTVARLGKKLRRVSTSTQIETGQLTSMLGQAFQGSKHVKSYGMESFEIARVGDVVEKIYKLMTRTFRTSAAATPLSEILSGLAVVTIIIYGGYQVLDGHTTPGKLFSFIAAFLLAYEPMKRMARMNNVLQMGLAALDRLFRVIDTVPAIKEKPDAASLTVRQPSVVFENVGFRYDDGTEALKGVSFEAPAGKTVALVGESGAGKSTILNLIPRFYDVASGRIMIDGHDVRDLTLKSLRDSMALVSQDVAVFNDTIRDNIVYGSSGATDEQVMEAARQAAAHDFIMDLPQGYDTFVGESGVKLSGGQRQRISIARAMLRNAPILLLDEATSALDAQSERQVQAALERLQAGRTTIVVAHRLSTIMNADMIYVLAQGGIAESGTHAELLAKGGIYTRLYGSMLRETA